MKIYLDNFEGHVALHRMLPYWKKMGHSATTNINDNSDVQLSSVRIGLKGKYKPIILRLDSIYYNSAENYNIRNLDISNSHSVVDGVIYQSNYSRMLIEKLLKPRKTNAKYDVIFNGIEPNWCGNFIEHDGINIVVSGKHRRHKRLKEIIELFLEYNVKYPNSKLHIFGKLHDNIEVRNNNIKYYGHVNREKMFEVFRKADFSIHLSKRDSCPNSVVEYISAGIPVITTNNCGGSMEMCQVTSGCIIVDGDGDYEDVRPVPHYSEEWNILSKDLKHNLLKSMFEMTENPRRVILPKELTAEYMAKKYISLMEGVL